MAVKSIEIFHDDEELSELTGLTRDELQKRGFDLDDFNGGIRVGLLDILSGTEGYRLVRQILFGDNVEDEGCSVENLLTQEMRNFCCGYTLVKYGDYLYYLVHHA